MHRHGELHLILSLPDGSTSMLPAVWTDFDGESPTPSTRILGSLVDLRQTRKVVNVLLKRQAIAETGPAEMEAHHATGTVSDRSGAKQNTDCLKSPNSGRTRSADQNPSTVARQSHPPTEKGSET